MLLEKDAAAMVALRALAAGQALTAAAKVSAHGALMAIEAVCSSSQPVIEHGSRAVDTEGQPERPRGR